jgi:hypothetical protein
MDPKKPAAFWTEVAGTPEPSSDYIKAFVQTLAQIRDEPKPRGSLDARASLGDYPTGEWKGSAGEGSEDERLPAARSACSLRVFSRPKGEKS